MSDRLQSIDILRGLAILAVLAIHCPHDAPGGYRENLWFLPSFFAGYGYFGVHLFVLLSGFCIHRRFAVAIATTGKCRMDWKKFWKRRFVRLYPPYLVAIVLSLFVADCCRTEAVMHDRFGWDLILHLALLHNLTEFGTSLGNGAFWSLGMEEQLYAGYFLLVPLLRHASTRITLAIIGCLTIGWRVCIPMAPAIDLGPFAIGKWYLWPLMFWLHWTLGAIAVEAAEGIRTLPRWCRSFWVACIALLLAMLLNRHFIELLVSRSDVSFVGSLIQEGWHPWLFTASELFAMLAFFCGLNGLLQREGSRWTTSRVSKLFANLGRVSYSVYLVHIPVITTLSLFISLRPTGVQWPLRALLFGGASIAGGWLFYHGVEKWFGREKAIRTWSKTSARHEAVCRA